MSSTVIRFTIELGFELMITVGAVFYPREEPTLLDIEEKTPLDTFCLWYTALIGVALLGHVYLTVDTTLNKGSVITKIESRLRTLRKEPDLEKVRQDAKIKAYFTSIPLERFERDFDPAVVE